MSHENIPLEPMGREGGLILTHAELMSEYCHVYKGIRGRKKSNTHAQVVSGNIWLDVVLLPETYISLLLKHQPLGQRMVINHARLSEYY